MKKQTFGLLLLHGFPNGPDYFDPLVARLAELSIPLRVPCLRGHATGSPEALRGVTWHDWLADAESALADLREEVDRAGVLGFSLGGALALRLAADHPTQVDSLVALAPGVQLASPLAPGKPFNFLVPLVAAFLKTWDFSPGPRQRYRGGYTWAPKDAVLSVLELARTARACLPQVTCPALLLQGRLDDAVDPRTLEIVFRAIATPPAQKQRHLYPMSGHDLLYDVEKEEICAAITVFLRERMNA
jgi:carboxylesterase